MNWESFFVFFADKPAFRLKQAQTFLFKNLITDWQEATSLPLLWQRELNTVFPINNNYQLFNSPDGSTTKIVLTLSDGQKVEAVLMRYEKGRTTICVSSQIGCAVKCAFCATGGMGFKRNLSPWEIAEQVLVLARILKSEDRRLTNIVFMGMGEPFLNMENLKESLLIIKGKDFFNLGNRHISISTVGIPEKIKEFADWRTEINLAVSLHASNDQKRKQIIPLAGNFSIKEILEAVDYYIQKTNRKVMFEYIMLKDFNDSFTDAEELSKLLSKKLYHLNLVRYNETAGIFKCSEDSTIKNFKKYLMDSGLNVTERFSFGGEVKGACGQLAGK